MQCHDVLQEQIVLSLCVCLSCLTPQVPLFHREHAQRECLQTVSQVSPIYLKSQVLCAIVFHRSRGNGTFFLYPQKHVLCPQVSPIDHRLDWVLVGLVWRILHVELLHKTVERVYRLAVVQLWSPIHHSLWSNCDRVSMRSLVVVRRQVWSFIQNFSSLQSFNFWNAISWKCSLKNNCIRSCLIEC